MENECENGGNPRNPEKTNAPKRRRGGQPGNRNAVKTGRHTAGAQARRAQRIVLRRDVNALLYWFGRPPPQP